MKRQEYYSSVSPKGQITLPSEVRMNLGIEPKDRVAIVLENGAIKIRRVGRLQDYFQTVPPLRPARDWKEVEEIAHDEHAEHVAREGPG